MSQDIPFHILADHGLPEFFNPYRIRVLLTNSLFNKRLFRMPLLRLLPVVALGCKCWWVSVRHRGPAPFVTCSTGSSFVFALLQYLCRPLIRPRTHVMYDLLLERKRTGLMGLFDSIKMHVFRKVVDHAVVWGPPDIDSFSREYDIPTEKFSFVPYHLTLENFQFDISDQGYIFAGGNNGRDYPTLIDAVSKIDYPVFIATQLPEVIEIAAPFPNIMVKPVTHEQFRQKMAGCHMFVEAHPVDFFRTAGHQTFLNAMWMGKLVVLADEKSAIGYIEDGKDGLVVAAGDAEGLKAKIQLALNDLDLSTRLAKAAQSKARDPKYRNLNHT